MIKSRAKVCRFCGHELNKLPARPKSERIGTRLLRERAQARQGQSPVFAALLSLVVVGAGHVYAGESSRGGYFFLAAFMFGVVGLAVPPLLLIPPAIAVVAAVDAYSIVAARYGSPRRRQ